MDIQFIGQGLNGDTTEGVGNYLIETLADLEQFNDFKAFVAFVSESGVMNILPELLAFKAKGHQVCMYVGVNLHGTSKEALQLLLDNDIETYVIYSPNNTIYHPKIYTFSGDQLFRTIIGSSNMTQSGLFQNMEASVLLNVPREDEGSGSQFMTDLFEYYNTILANTNPSCQELTPELLDLLVANKIVLPAKEAFKNSNTISKNTQTVDENDYAQLMKTFDKVKVAKPKRQSKKTVKKNNRHHKTRSI